MKDGQACGSVGATHGGGQAESRLPISRAPSGLVDKLRLLWRGLGTRREIVAATHVSAGRKLASQTAGCPQAEEAVAQAPAAGRLAAVARGRGTILVVEDGEAVRQVIAAMLRESGYTVMPCANAREAIPLGEHFDGEISLLITDVVLPDTSGPNLARRLRAARPDMPILFITGYGESVLAGHGIDVRIAPVLTKPFSRDDLIRMVEKTLATGCVR